MLAWTCINTVSAFIPSSSIVQQPSVPRRSARVVTGMLTPEIRLPRTDEQQMRTAADAIGRARSDGVYRQSGRYLLQRDGLLVPPDETWTGGIMQLYYVTASMAQNMLRRLSPPTAGVPPRLLEQRLDKSGCDGEALWIAQCADAAEDISFIVQPSLECADEIARICSEAGEKRLVYIMNPQWKESDDTLDFIAGKGGLLGSLGAFLGGKAKVVQQLEGRGFTAATETFNLAEVTIAGTQVRVGLLPLTTAARSRVLALSWSLRPLAR